MVNRLSTMQETLGRFLCREDPLENEMATHSSTLAWKIPWTEEPGKPQSVGSQRVRHDWAIFFFMHGSYFHTQEYALNLFWGFLVVKLVENSYAMWETWVQSLSGEDPLEKGTATHSIIPTIFWPGEFHRLYSPWDHKESDTTEQLSLHFTSESILK